MDRRHADGFQGGMTKYIFAGSDGRDDEATTKACPRCGQLLFADMDVCFGCLYDFERDGRPDADRPAARAAGRGEVPRTTSGRVDPLAAIELDEIDDDPPVVPRHRKVAEGAGDTLDLGSPELTVVQGEGARPFDVVVRSEGLRVRVPLPQGGLSVGRAESNDVMLSLRSVSRSHVRLVPGDDRVMVEDCGATNPATVGDTPLEGTAVLREGDAVCVCGTTFEVARRSGAVGL